MSYTKIGLFGGSFDPIHTGHLITASAVAQQLSLQQVVFIPSALPPHKLNQQLAPPADRLAMVKLAIQADQRFVVSDIELNRTGPSYTLHTVGHLQEIHSQARMFWIIGADSLVELPSWYQVSELLDICQIVTASRPGWDPSKQLQTLADKCSKDQLAPLSQHILTTPLIQISSTDIRRRTAAGQSTRYLLPEPVRTYITEHKLYKDTTS